MGVNAARWTKEQALAIETGGRPLLISAAAGSGKTSVLSARVVSLLAGDQGRPPMDADRMLIVTFTRAAAAELRKRITKDLERRAANDPHNENLQRQRRLLPMAQISTIDSLCKTILEQNFERLGLPAKFSIIQGSALTTLTDEVILELLEQSYAVPDEGFLALRQLCESGSEQKLMEIISKTYATACAEPSVSLWIESCKRKMAKLTARGYEKEKRVLEELSKQCDALIEAASCLPDLRFHVKELLENPKRKPKDFEAKRPERMIRIEEYGVWGDALTKAIQALQTDAPGIDAYTSALRELPKRPTKTGFKLLYDSERLTPWVDVWGNAAALQKQLSAYAAANFSHDRTVMLAVEKVYELVLQLHRDLRSRKNALGQLAFYDLEQEAVRLLADAALSEDGSITFTQTEAAKEIAQNYDCVMVDECQDNNSVQDIVFRMLTDGTDKLFMVGDVKQSIYRFRHAKPELFSHRQQSYKSLEEAKEGEAACIVLKDNFRSRASVIDAVNYLFYRIMSVQSGEVAYDRDAAMRAGMQYPGIHPPHSDAVELHLLDNYREDKRLPKIDQEEYIASVIAGMVASRYPVTDRDENGEQVLRPCRFGDFMVLMRNRTHMGKLIKALDGLHISYHTEGIKGFYDTSEIKACIAMMQTAKNPQDDLSLWGFLLSPFCLFDFDDTAVLRLVANAHGCRYIFDALRIAANDRALSICGKAMAAVSLIEDLRKASLQKSAGEFLQYAFVRSSFRQLLKAGEDGEQKCVNLDLLCKDAASWETDHFGGITGYLQYIGRLIENGEDIASATALEQNEDVVQVMTIHGSKGLEAPIVMLCSCEKTFSSEDVKKGYLLDPVYGLTLEYRDPEQAIRYYNTAGMTIKDQITAANRAEEMRLLYVAMTRAREKLICVGSVDNLSSRLKTMHTRIKAASDGCEGGRLPDLFSAEVSNYLDWLMAGLTSDPSAARKLQAEGYPAPETLPYASIAANLDLKEDHPFSFKLCIQKAEGFTAAAQQEAFEETAAFTPLAAPKEIVERMLARYPYDALTDIPAKSSVTALSHREETPLAMDLFQKHAEEALLEERSEETLFVSGEMPETEQAAPNLLRLPDFLLEEAGRVTGAMRGTATHNFLQYADFKAAACDLNAEIDRLVAEQFIGETDAALLDRYAIRRFLQSALCARIIRAEEEGNILREYPFVHALPAGAFYALNEQDGKEQIVVQGIADCILFEQEGLTLIDYKTDRLKEDAQFVSRYQKQLAIYAEALNLLFADCYPGGQAVKRCVIYALSLGREIEVGVEKGL